MISEEEIEKLVDKALDWFTENDVLCPTKVKDWVYVGKQIPPGMGREKLRSLGISAKEIINRIYGKEIVKKYKPSGLNYESLGLELISKTRKSSTSIHYDIHFKCLNCNEIHVTDYCTIVRWFERGCKFCAVCRGSSGKVKSLDYYQDMLPDTFQILEYIKGDVKYSVKHKPCNTVFTISRAHLASKDTEAILCPHCDSTNIFGSKRVGKYASLLEEELTEYFKEIYTGEFSLQTHYYELMPTNRKFRVDIYVPKHKVIIEITSSNNKIPKYIERLTEKRELAESNGFKFFKVTSKSMVKDIVRYLEETPRS